VKYSRPVADSYEEVTRGPARDSADVWERRRWWSRALGLALAFVGGSALIHAAAWMGIPGVSRLSDAPVAVFDLAALVAGGLVWLAFRSRWPLANASGQVNRLIDRMIR